MSAAKLPEDLIRPAARRLADLNEGETGYVIPWDLEVDLERRCYLNPRAALFDRASMLIEVSRRSDGYHVTVISKLPSWTPTANISPNWIPVQSITKKLDPDLDLDEKIADLNAKVRRPV